MAPAARTDVLADRTRRFECAGRAREMNLAFLSELLTSSRVRLSTILA